MLSLLSIFILDIIGLKQNCENISTLFQHCLMNFRYIYYLLELHKSGRPVPPAKTSKHLVGGKGIGIDISTQRLQDVKLRKIVTPETFQPSKPKTNNKEESGVDTSSGSVTDIKKRFDNQSFKGQKSVRPDSGYQTASNRSSSCSGYGSASGEFPGPSTKINRGLDVFLLLIFHWLYNNFYLFNM